jgi:hypothetical protein
VTETSSSHAAGVALMVLAGLLAGGAYSLFTREPRTQVVLIASLLVGVVALVLLFSGYTRLG